MIVSIEKKSKFCHVLKELGDIVEWDVEWISIIELMHGCGGSIIDWVGWGQLT